MFPMPAKERPRPNERHTDYDILFILIYRLLLLLLITQLADITDQHLGRRR